MKKEQIIRHGSLFSGIGGFDLAAEWMGWDNVFQCETDPFCRWLLNYYYPKAVQYGDIRKTDFRQYKGRIDILTGGFPCQPFSVAGKRLGKEDERHLWPYMLSAIRQIRPRWVVGENVLGIINWNQGLVFEEVQSDLEAEGYQVQPYVLPASGLGAPHRRDRVWFIANTTGDGYGRNRPRQDRRQAGEGQSEKDQRQRFQHEPDRNDAAWASADPAGLGRDGRGSDQQRRHDPETFKPPGNDRIPGWENFPQTQPAIRIGNDGIPDPLDFDAVLKNIPMPVRPLTFSKWRTESIKALGNAIVPQVAYQIFSTIQQIMNLKR